MRGKLVYEMLNSIEGVSCNKVMGAMYAFPRIYLPKKAIVKAEVSMLLHKNVPSSSPRRQQKSID